MWKWSAQVSRQSFAFMEPVVPSYFCSLTKPKKENYFRSQKLHLMAQTQYFNRVALHKLATCRQCKLQHMKHVGIIWWPDLCGSCLANSNKHGSLSDITSAEWSFKCVQNCVYAVSNSSLNPYSNIYFHLLLNYVESVKRVMYWLLFYHQNLHIGDTLRYTYRWFHTGDVAACM